MCGTVITQQISVEQLRPSRLVGMCTLPTNPQTVCMLADENVVFLFLVHPYDIGEVLFIDGDQCKVRVM